MTQAQSTLHHALGLETPFARLGVAVIPMLAIAAPAFAGGGIQGGAGKMRSERLALRTSRQGGP